MLAYVGRLTKLKAETDSKSQIPTNFLTET